MHWSYISFTLSRKQLETHRCLFCAVDTDGLVLKHQAISIPSADCIYNKRHWKWKWHFDKISPICWRVEPVGMFYPCNYPAVSATLYNKWPCCNKTWLHVKIYDLGRVIFLGLCSVSHWGTDSFISNKFKSFIYFEFQVPRCFFCQCNLYNPSLLKFIQYNMKFHAAQQWLMKNIMSF